MRSLILVLPLFVFGVADAGTREQPPYRSLTQEFAKFAEETRSLPTAERVARFKTQFDELLPGFYEPSNGETPEQFDGAVTRALESFPAIQERFEQVDRTFPSIYATALSHFRKQFPRFQPTLPIWFIHSLGRLDGGVRILHDKPVMIFGADVIARIHSDATIGPFLDHELFHVENGQWFKDCEPEAAVWCGLWQEGLAVYAASVMNPGATDQMLLLDKPKPIRAPVDANWHAAVCALSQDLEKGDLPTYSRYFFGGSEPEPGALPRRAGYYLGYRLAQRVGSRFSLPQMDRFDAATVHRVVKQELAAMVQDAGGCESQ